MSNPKEKAHELVNKFKEYADENYMDNKQQFELNETRNINAKNCALIAVDEIIKSCPIELVGNAGKFTYTEDYWQEVKTEIEKL